MPELVNESIFFLKLQLNSVSVCTGVCPSIQGKKQRICYVRAPKHRKVVIVRCMIHGGALVS